MNEHTQYPLWLKALSGADEVQAPAYSQVKSAAQRRRGRQRHKKASTAVGAYSR